MQNQSDVEALKAECADKKALLADIDVGKVTLPPEQVASLRMRVAALEARIKQINADRT